MDFQNYFKVKVKEILGRLSGKKAIVFFEGFAPEQNQILLSGFDGLIQPSTVLEGKYLNIPAISLQENKRKTMQKILTADNHVLVGVYEQYTAIASSLQDLYSGEIVIVVNNLFQQFYPCAIAPETAKRLYQCFQKENPDIPDELKPYFDIYGDAEMVRETCLLSPVDRHTDEGITAVPFFDSYSPKFLTQRMLESNCTLSVSSTDFSAHIADILSGQAYTPTTYIVDSENCDACQRLACWVRLLDSLNLTYGIQLHSRFEQVSHTEDNKYLPLLQKYWGMDAKFRILQFYCDPHNSNETVSVSQGHIVSTVIAQSEKALNGNHDFNNIFITAPTGAGKSLLFQLPAIYLSEKFDAVTIVVTPLIALMDDQVKNLEAHHVFGATYLNSDITYEERQSRIEKIRDGKISIVYIAPEMLFANSIENLIGERPIGLFVVDEAHIVTSWGKDFRADYWYLGDFLNGLRQAPAKGSMGPHKKALLFPILCLTATAVYGGSEDVVNETIESLNLDNPLLFLGSVRRSNISFDINHIDRNEFTGGIDEFKTKKAAERINSFVKKGERTLVYCPYIKQVENISVELESDAAIRNRVAVFHGKLNKDAKKISQERFRSGDCTAMVCTKAFGMGIDIKDIQNVYHYAPSGNLADYVQEIGRAARKPEIKGHAIVDFLNSDLRYTRILYGLSGLKQYQLKEMLRKLYDIYSTRRHRYLLISPDTFSYLFEAENIENKVKCGLLLIAKDLVGKYGFPVIVVRPKSMMTKNYVNVPPATEQPFIEKYGAYAKKLQDKTRRIVPSPKGSNIPPTIVTNSGKIYEIDMARLWEDNFSDLTFMNFKYQFFAGTLFQFDNGEHLSARIRVTIHYNQDFQTVLKKFTDFLKALSEIFRAYKQKRTEFTIADFKADLGKIMDLKTKQYGFPELLLNLFVKDVTENITLNNVGGKYRFIASHKATSGNGLVYRVLSYNYITMAENFGQLLNQCAPNDGITFESFFPAKQNESHRRLIDLLSMLELLKLASYEIKGGESLEIFIRINDPLKVRQLAHGNYSNALLTDLHKRHESAQKVMMRFFEGNFSDDERWDIIENYFLGREDIVDHLLSAGLKKE